LSRGSALWRDASHVCAPADRTGRIDRARVVVGVAVLEPWPSESFAGEPHRLVLVHRLTDCFWRRCGHCRRPAGGDANPREPVLRRTRRSRSSRNHFTKRRETPVNSLRYLCVTAAIGTTLLLGCGSPHGRPSPGSEIPVPSEIVDFRTLYA